MTSSARPRHEAYPAIDAAVLDDLVRRAQHGGIAAFNSLVLRYQDALYSLVARMLTDRAAAEDVTQEAFVAAWRNIVNFDITVGPWSEWWVYQAVSKLGQADA